MKISRRAIVTFLVTASLAFAQKERSKLDTQLPATPVEVAACSGLLHPKGPLVGENIFPYMIPGITPEEGQTISMFVVPDTPVFRFYVDNQETFRDNEIAFPAGMQCFMQGKWQKDQFSVFKIPEGNYLVIVVTSLTQTTTGVGQSDSTAYDPFTGTPITVHTPTAYTNRFTRRRTYTNVFTNKEGKWSHGDKWAKVAGD